MKYLLALLLTFPTILSRGQSCDTLSLNEYQVRASDTDPNIAFELAQHYAWYNSACSPKNTLLVHLVGSYDNPKNTLLFPKVAANNGFHVVSLKYPNGTAAQTACGNSADPDCYWKFRKEILEGTDVSSEVDVDTIDCVYNRLIKLLQHLATNHPSENWDQFFSGNTITWSNVMVSGHSQGGGHAAVIAADYQLKRVLMFASPNDYSAHFSGPANWTSSSHVTPDSVYYGFNNLNDDVVDFSDQFEIWNNLGMPTFGDTINVDNSTPHYSYTRQLYTKYDTSGSGTNHSAVVRDDETPRDSNSDAVFEPVWKYMLGIAPLTSNVRGDFHTNYKPLVYPNPANDQITIELRNPVDHWTVTIYNNVGQPLEHVQQHSSKRITLQSNNLSSGVYFYQITSQDFNLGAGKLIIVE